MRNKKLIFEQLEVEFAQIEITEDEFERKLYSLVLTLLEIDELLSLDESAGVDIWEAA